MVSSLRTSGTIFAASVLALSAPANAQESVISNDPFDPYVGVLTPIAESSLSQSGTKRAQETSINLSTFRMRSSGRIEHYLKVEISYILAAKFGITDRIDAEAAFYEGGGKADFEVIEKTENCVPSGLCKATEVLSVRFPFQSVQGRPIKIQFRDRGGSWRGAVTVPSQLFAHNLEQLKKVR